MMTLKANYLTLAVQQEKNQNVACELPVAAVDVLSAHRLAASFYVTAQRGHSLKARLTEGDIVRLMSPRFPPPPPPPTSSISLLLLGRSALFSSFAFLLGLLFPPPPHNHTSFPTLALSPHIHSRNRQMRRGTNASFFIRLHLTWRFTCLSESKTIQLHYLSVKHAAAARPAAGNEVFLHCWGG